MIRNILKYRVSTSTNALKGVLNLMFEPEKEISKQIVPVSLPIVDLVPDFFTNDINYYEL